MQFFKALCAAAAFAVAQAVIITNTAASFEGVTAGSTFAISWANATGSVTLILKNGPSNALVTVSTIASGLTTSPYDWSIPSTLPTDYYAIEIEDSAGINYSEEFQITGGPSSSSSSVAFTATSGSASMASSASTKLASTMTSSASLSTSTTTSGSSSSGSSSNSTSTSGSSTHKSASTTSTSPHSSSTATAASTSSISSAAGVASPLAFVFLAFAAILTLN